MPNEKQAGLTVLHFFSRVSNRWSYLPKISPFIMIISSLSFCTCALSSATVVCSAATCAFVCAFATAHFACASAERPCACSHAAGEEDARSGSGSVNGTRVGRGDLRPNGQGLKSHQGLTSLPCALPTRQLAVGDAATKATDGKRG